MSTKIQDSQHNNADCKFIYFWHKPPIPHLDNLRESAITRLGFYLIAVAETLKHLSDQ
jgi:hypothetical protein